MENKKVLSESVIRIHEMGWVRYTLPYALITGALTFLFIKLSDYKDGALQQGFFSIKNLGFFFAMILAGLFARSIGWWMNERTIRKYNIHQN